jgi:hypothetical protein|nr:MAG TPA: hypothetical protein [Caudoviricetes sp.]
MSLQSDIRAVADAAFEQGERSKGLAFAIGFAFGVTSANKVEETTNPDKTFLELFFQSTSESISVLNETLLFDVREAQRITRAIFNLVTGVRSKAVVVNEGSSLLEVLFNVSSYLDKEDVDFFNSNIVTCVAIYQLIRESQKPDGGLVSLVD